MAALSLLGVPSFMCSSRFTYIFPKPALEYLLAKTVRPDASVAVAPSVPDFDDPNLEGLIDEGLDMPVDDANSVFLDRCDAHADRMQQADRLRRRKVYTDRLLQEVYSALNASPFVYIMHYWVFLIFFYSRRWMLVASLMKKLRPTTKRYR